MKVRTIRTNYALNLTRTVLSTVISLFTLPYINSTLGVVSVGKFEYVNSIVSYFVLFSALGVPMYGIREIARVRNDPARRTKVTVELLLVLAITTVFSYLLLFGFFIQLDFLQSYRSLILVLAPSIFLSNLGMEWFFQGIEDQLYITIRFIIIKIVTLILLFTLIKSPDDYVLYGLIMTISAFGSNFFNFFYIRKFLEFKTLKWKELNVRKHIQGIFTIFLATVSIAIYLQLDNTLLGIYGGPEHVGIYATANKLVRFAILFITTLGSVMLPRLSYLYAQNDQSQYYAYLSKNLSYILFFSVPSTVLLFSLAKPIILVMAGDEFIAAVAPMKILTALLPIVGIAYFLAFMVLYPQGRENVYTKVVFVSAVISVFLNVALIPHYFEMATAIVSVVVEFAAVLLMILYVRNRLSSFRLFKQTHFNYLFGGCIVFILSQIVAYYVVHPIVNIVATVCIGMLLYMVFLYYMKDPIYSYIIKKISSIR